MSHNEMKGALPANAWLDQEQLVIRLREEEIVEIDDFFTNVATKEMMHKIKQQKELGILNNEEELLLEDDDIQQPPLLSFGVEKKQVTESLKTDDELQEITDKNELIRRKRLEEMTKDELLTHLAKIPTLIPSPVCDFTVEDGKRLRGTIEKIKGEYVYIKVAFGKKWIKYTLRQIKDIKIVRF